MWVGWLVLCLLGRGRVEKVGWLFVVLVLLVRRHGCISLVILYNENSMTFKIFHCHIGTL